MTGRVRRQWTQSGLLCAWVAVALPACSHNDPRPATVTGVTVTGDTATVPGQTLQLTATANMSDGTNQNVTGVATWTPANAGVATVSPTGVVTGVAVGDTSITATHMNLSGALNIGIKAVIARFTVSNATAADVCRIVPSPPAPSSGGLDCTFNGSTSLGAPTTWSWSFVVGTTTGTSGPRNTPTFVPNPGCGFFTTKADQVGNTGSVQMIVRLIASKAQGQSEEVTNQNVRLFPQNQCGYGF